MSQLPLHIQQIIGKSSEQIKANTLSNCFWASQYYFDPKAYPPKKLTGNDLLQFIANEFTQVDDHKDHDIFIVWSSTDITVSPNKINVHYLSTYPEGFPFGLVVEHSGILLPGQKVFQKASPKPEDLFELIDFRTALAPYESFSWKRITYHRRNV